MMEVIADKRLVRAHESRGCRDQQSELFPYWTINRNCAVTQNIWFLQASRCEDS